MLAGPPAQIDRKAGIFRSCQEQRKSYDRAEREGIVHLRELGAEVQVQHVLELIARLKQICNADPKTGESSKIEDIRERIETLTQQGNRALVFSQYTSAGFGVGCHRASIERIQPTFVDRRPFPRRPAVGHKRVQDRR